MNLTKQPYNGPWQIALRTLLAGLGGYALSVTSGLLLSFILPTSREHAIVYASMLSFAIMTAAIMWAFALASWQQVAKGMLLANLVCGLLAWLAYSLEVNL